MDPGLRQFQEERPDLFTRLLLVFNSDQGRMLGFLKSEKAFIVERAGQSLYEAMSSKLPSVKREAFAYIDRYVKQHSEEIIRTRIPRSRRDSHMRSSF